MDRRRSDSSVHVELVRMVRLVRHRWRMRVAARGAAILLGVLLAGFLVTALVLDRLEFSPGAVGAGRAVLALLLIGAGVRFLLLPLLQRVTDEQVALYIEEHEPSLQATLVSALDAGAHSDALAPGLVRRTVEQAVERCRRIEYGRGIERPDLWRAAGVGAGVVALALLSFFAGPSFVGDSVRALFLPEAAAREAAARRIEVFPGSVTVPRGADQKVALQAIGFAPEGARIGIRAASDSAFEHMPMLETESGSFEITLFELGEVTEYFVEAEGVRSKMFRIEVAEVPYVDRLDLELVYPSYTGLAPHRIEDGGDVVALPGTVVRVRAQPTRAVAGGRVVLDDGRTVALEADSSGALLGQFRVQRTGYYHIELGAGADAILGSPQYLIDALEDKAPTVSFVQPGRDTKVTSVDEVFVEAQAEDDFGIASLELVYSVNGDPEQSVPLYAAAPLAEVSAGHTLYLEEMGLEPGDFVSYYARASDNRPGAEKGTTVSDIYFMEIRPFGRDYRQAEQGGGGGGMQGAGGGSGGVDGELSQRQREIIAATFNLVRDRETYSETEYREHLVTLRLAQDRLREQVETLAQRMMNRGVVRDTSFEKIAETLPRAAREMEAASGKLAVRDPQEALPPEQRALQQLQRAEAIYRDVQVAMGGGGGGGGGGASPNAEDLADLFGLELDKLRNQYEVVQRGERQEMQQELRESMDRLSELARRQQQENERMRQELAQRMQRAGSGGAGQRQLAEQTEEEARRLERLAREQSRPELMDAARRLQEAAESMRRASSSGRAGGQGAADEALERLREAQRRLQRQQSSGVEEGVRDAMRQADRLAAEQREIAREMEGLAGTEGGRPEQARELIDRKERQAGAIGDLQRQIDRLATESRGQNEEAARELREAGRSIRENRLEERVRQSRLGVRAGASPEYVRRMEELISSGIDELREELGQAGEAMGSGSGQGTEENLDRARRLAQGLESLQERMRAAREGQAREGQGQRQGEESSGQEGSQPQGGEQSGQQQGQQGQQGQGQQGQEGQGQQQGQGSEGGEGGEGGEPGRLDRLTEGGTITPGSGWSGAGGNIAPDDVRQFRGEARERLEQARELRNRLAQEGYDVSELDQVIAGLRELDDGRVWADWEELSHLQASLVDRLKKFEFSLRQEIMGETQERVFLSGGAEVPAEYRELVEEYYRALAEQRRR